MTDNRDLEVTLSIRDLSQSASDYEPGSVVGGDYRLVQLLGRGGMGTVYTAEHRYIRGKLYALKLLSRDQVTDENLKRFQREAVALARLAHPGIVQIYNFGIDKDVCPFYVMEIVEGISLAELISQSGPLDEFRALDLFIQIADALDYAHRSGIVHRDIKPSNLMLVKQKGDLKPQIKIVDFGIVRLAIDDEREKQKLTATGDIFGTPFYMSPEQTIAGQITFASDIYSLGCTLFEVLTGRPPFRGDSAFATLEQHQRDKPPTLRSICPSARFSDAIEAIVARMLAKRPEDRYPSMQHLGRDLIRAQEGKRVYAAGLTVAELDQPLFEVDSNSAIAIDRSTSAPKQWILPLAVTLCILLSVVVFILLSKPVSKAVHVTPKGQLDPWDLKNAGDKVAPFIEGSDADGGVVVTTFESPQKFKDDYAKLRNSLITISLNSGKPMPEFAGTEHAEQSDTGKLAKAIALLNEVKKIGIFKISSSASGVGVTELNQADVIAIEKAPPCEVFHLSDLTVPLESFMKLKYLKSVKSLKLANLIGLPPSSKAESLSYVLTRLNDLPALQHLVLYGYRLSDTDVDLLCHSRHLEALELFDTQLPPQFVYRLTHNSSLKVLVLANQTFSPAEVRQILEDSKLNNFVVGRPHPDTPLERAWSTDKEKSVKSISPAFSFHLSAEGDTYSAASGAVKNAQ